ncbi:alanine/glycine:cation symporter family protein [candidate division KSB1 bacterium]
MQDQLIVFFQEASRIIWGPPMILLLVGTGLYLTIILRGLQFRTLLHSLHLALIKRREETNQPGDITHFQALMTALAATVGTGNIAGVATALTVGGPGALVWMWVTGLVGMATKYSEAVLGVKYREVSGDGRMMGGPMYYISKGLRWRFLGTLFALFAAVSAFGTGNMIQSNSVADVVRSTLGVPVWITSIIIATATALVIIGGIKGIARVTSLLVPMMILIYMAGALVLIGLNLDKIPGVLALVFRGAFSPTAAAGGFLGASVMMTLRTGISRGVLSNESGLGSSPIAAAAAQTKTPTSQALVSMTQTFIDTLVVCTMTGLVILLSGAWTSGATGAPLTAMAFEAGLPVTWGKFIVPFGLVLFAYSTILGWSYYGERSIEFLLGPRSITPYRVVFCLFVLIGGVSRLELVWAVADCFNGLMALPNLIGLLALSSVIVKETRDHFRGSGRKF